MPAPSGPYLCAGCRTALGDALDEVRRAALAVAAAPTALLIARYNRAQASVSANLHYAWKCQQCAALHQSNPAASLFPELDT